MAYTYTQLIKAYAAVHGGIEPPPEVASQLMLMTNASYSDADRLNYILNSADDSMAVAVMTYQFFTGKSPKADGIAWLLNSDENPTDLSDPAFANFNLEHRFMNFAASLGMSGERRASFEASYGALTYAGYVASIYDSIIGMALARAAGLDPDKIIQDVIARQDLILASARAAGMVGPNATTADIDLALKVATAAYLLAEGIKADVGVYAAATNNFMLGVAKGDAVYNTDITQTYAPNANSGSSGTGKAVDNPPPATSLPGGPPPQLEPEPQQPQPPVQPQNFVLTPGTDRLIGNVRDDTFTGTHLTFNDGDQLDGGAGNDTLTVTVTGGALFTPPNSGVKNIETFTLNSDGAVEVNTYDWTGLQQVNTTSVGRTDLAVHEGANVNATVTGQGGGEINIRRGEGVTVTATGATDGAIRVGSDFAVSGDVVVSRVLTGNNVAGSITVNGGETVSITQTVDAVPGQRQKNGGVEVTGSQATTSVTVKAAQATADIDANVVAISDINGGGGSKLAGTITAASIDGYATATFTGTALTDLRLAHGGDAIIDNSSDGAPSATTLNLAVNGLANAALSDANVYTTLNITTGAQASTLSSVSFGKVEALAVAGDSRLTLTSASGLSALKTVTITGAAGLTANLSGATVTSVDASGAAGDNTLTLDGAKASFTGGSGVDAITVTAGAVSKAIALGGGDDILDLTRATSLIGLIDGGAGTDTLKISVAAAASLKGQSSLISNVEAIVLDGTGVADVGSALAGATGLATLTTTGAAGLTANLSSASAAFVDASGANGANTVTIDGSKTRFTGGAGVDVVTITSAAVSKAIALGDGDDILDLAGATSVTGALSGGAGDDTLKMTAALAATLIGQTPSISGFEILQLNAGAAATLGSNLSVFGALKTVKVTGASALSADLSSLTTLTAVDASAGTGANTLTLDASKASFTGGPGVDVITVAAGAVGKALSLGGGDDTLDLTHATSLTAALDGGDGADILKMTTVLAAALMFQTPSISNFETVQLTMAGGGAGMTNIDLSSWTGVEAVNLTGANNGGFGMVLTNPTGADLVANVSNVGRSNFYTLGGDNVTLNFTGVTGGDIYFNDAPTGDVSVTLEHDAGASSGSLNLAAGGNVSLTQTASNGVGTTAYLFRATIKGGAATTSVVVRNAHEVAADGAHAGVAFSAGPPSVSVNDINTFTSNLGVITSIDIDGYDGVHVYSSGLTTLKLAHGRGNVAVATSSVAGAPTALNLSLSAVKGGVLTLGTGYTTLNITTGADASSLDAIQGSLTALNVSGASTLTMASVPSVGSLQTVTVTGAAGVVANLAGAVLTAIDASGTTGDNTVTIDARNATYAGGSGVDRVTITGDLLKTITLGDGDDFLDTTAMTGWGGRLIDGGAGAGDVVRMTTAGAQAFAHQLHNFERLELVGAGGTINASRYDHITAEGGNSLVLTDLTSGDTLRLTGAGTDYTLQFSDARPTFNLELVDNSGSGVNFASSGLALGGVETLNVTVTDGQATPSGAFKDTVTLLGNDLKTVTFSGNAGVALTASSINLTSVDASGITMGGFNWTVGNLQAAATIKGAAGGTNNINLDRARLAPVTYEGGAGNDLITAYNDKDNVIHLGEGDNRVDAAFGHQTITAGSGNDRVTINGGYGTVDLGDGDNNFFAGPGDHHYTGGAGKDTVQVSSGANVIDVGSGDDFVTVISFGGASNTVFTSIIGFGVGDKLTIVHHNGTSSPTAPLGAAVTLGGSPTLQNYLDAAAAGDAHSTAIMSWFRMGGDTYVVLDNSGSNTFVAGIDAVVKLVGVTTLDLTGLTPSGDTLTF